MVHVSPSAFVDVQVMEAGELAEIIYESYVLNASEWCCHWWRDRGWVLELEQTVSCLLLMHPESSSAPAGVVKSLENSFKCSVDASLGKSENIFASP